MCSIQALVSSLALLHILGSRFQERSRWPAAEARHGALLGRFQAEGLACKAVLG